MIAWNRTGRKGGIAINDAAHSSPARHPSRSWLISYDIADPKRLRRVERAVAAVGERVHYSLFFCELKPVELVALQRRLARLIHADADCIQYAPWCPRDRASTTHMGTSAEPSQAAVWVV